MSNVKKMLGVIMAAMLCFALTPAAAFAANGESMLTIQDPAANHTYKVYQMLTGDVAKDLTDGAATVSNIKAGDNLKGEVADFLKEIKGKSEAELGDIVKGFLKGYAYSTLDVGENEASVSVRVPNGYYLIVDETQNATDAMSRFMVQVSGPTTVKPKADSPELDKSIAGDNNLDDSTNTAAIGDVVTYELKATLGDMTGYKAYQIVFRDKLSAGLTFNDDSIKVYKGTSAEGKELAEDQYEVIALEGYTFGVRVKNVLPDAKAGDVFTVKYTAVVNENAKIGNEANPNTADLMYSNNPGSTSNGNPGDVKGITPEDTVKTYVTQLAIIKVGEDNKPLTGVEFTLSGSSLKQVKFTKGQVFVESAEGAYYALKDGTYTTDEPTEATADQYASTDVKYALKANNYVSTASGEGDSTSVKGFVDEEGLLTFTGLNAGKYTISESATPDGYNTITDITFQIKAIKDGDSVKWVFVDGEGKELTPNADGIVEIDGAKFNTTNNVFTTTIVNTTGTMLPSTGGIGTTIFYIVGGILVVGAVAFLIVRRRSSSTK